MQIFTGCRFLTFLPQNVEPDIYSNDPLLLTQEEERRHLWTHLVTTDWLSSCGRTYSCSAAQYNTLVCVLHQLLNDN